MAENVGIPAQTEDGRRFSYPWSDWLSEPFAQWVATPYDDFPVIDMNLTTSIARFMSQLHKQAARKGLGVTARSDDPEARGRVTFQFFPSDKRRPGLVWASSALAVQGQNNDSDSVPRIECQFCGAEQVRTPQFTVVEECLIRNPNDPRDPHWYARHRATDDLVGMKKLDNDFTNEWSWSKEEGPTHA